MSTKLNTVTILLLMIFVFANGLNLAMRRVCKNTRKPYMAKFSMPQQSCRTMLGHLPVFVAPGLSNRPANRQPSELRDNTQTAQEVMKLFPGLFLNSTSAKELNKKLKKEIILPVKPGGIKPGGIKPEPGGIKPGGIKPGITSQKKPGIAGRKVGPNHDGDLHCPTFRELVKAPDTLLNVQKESRDIVHFASEQVYQYVHKGTCGSQTTQSCSAGGCLQEQSIVYLMVWKDNPDWPTGFEPFEVDSYCSCKGITQ